MTQPDLRLGMINMVLSCVAFACVWVLIRFLGETTHFLMIVFARNLVGVVLVAPQMMRHGPQVLSTDQWSWHVVRGVTGLSAAVATFYAVTHAPLADVVAITYAAPLFAALMAILVLGEMIRARRVFALAIGFLGMLIVVRPGYQELTPGLLAAVGAALTMAGSMTLVKVLSRQDSPETIVSLNFLLMMPFATLLALPVWEWPGPKEAILMVLVGIGAHFGQICFARAFAYAESTAILPLDFTRLLLAALFGYVFFSERLDVWTGVGAAVILASTIYVAHRERVAAQRERHDLMESLKAPPPRPFEGD